jgi:hypothetical protein
MEYRRLNVLRQNNNSHYWRYYIMPQDQVEAVAGFQMISSSIMVNNQQIHVF